ncbi:MAG: aldehyde dehydrogenase family protein [Chlorobiaceae bacterium]|nr:aldehyde dehydrogenase family protein [Chlorobiaceae bacterium]
MDLSSMQQRLATLRSTFQTGRTSEYAWRRSQLTALQRFLAERGNDLAEALRLDFGKSPAETFFTETAFVGGEVRHALRNLRKWMMPERVRLPLHYRFGRARVETWPLGVVLVIGAWNYPINTCLAPLVSALAAGNCVVLKPSEQAPHTSRLLVEGIAKYLDDSAVEVVEGGAEEARALLREPFDCIFYTGSRRVGREIMLAASEKLTPVILELGGKCPCIVEKNANLRAAARRIAWAKFLNAGQTCIAPDYLLVHRDVADELLPELKTAIGTLYGPDPERSADYARIVSHRHFDRLESLMHAGKTAVGGERERNARYIAPTILTNISPEDAVMKEEIFGPILPVLTYGTIDDALSIVSRNPDPLAVYLFTPDNVVIEKVKGSVRSGGFCINDLLFQSAIHGLPFGGTGQSGFGRYHGRAGFDAFSYRRSVFHHSIFPDPSLRYPPYGPAKFAFLRKIVEMFDT